MADMVGPVAWAAAGADSAVVANASTATVTVARRAFLCLLTLCPSLG
jgi:hypothetical protein